MRRAWASVDSRMSVRLAVTRDVGWSLGPGRGYVGVVEFSADGGMTDAAQTLLGLIEHPRYHDDYLTQDSETNSIPGAHGPYLLDRITPENFVRISREDVARRLARFAREAAPVPIDENGRRAILEEAAGLDRDAYAYELIAGPDQPQHELGWSIGSFEEFVLIDPDGTRVVLIVAVVD